MALVLSLRPGRTLYIGAEHHLKLVAVRRKAEEPIYQATLALLLERRDQGTGKVEEQATHTLDTGRTWSLPMGVDVTAGHVTERDTVKLILRAPWPTVVSRDDFSYASHLERQAQAEERYRRTREGV